MHINEQLNKNNYIISKISFLLSLITGFVIVALLLYLCVVDNIEMHQSREDDDYSVVESYSSREIKSDEAPIGVIDEYTFSVGKKLKHDTYLSFYTVHQYVDVYLDGNHIYSLEPSKSNRIGKTVGSNWIMIPIYREDEGKEIRVEITPVYKAFRNRKVEFVMGSQYKIYTYRLYQDLPQLILGIIAVFVGFLFICIAIYNLWKKYRGRDLAALGLLSVMMGLWRLTDTRFTPFLIYDKPVFLFYISVIMLMIGMVPLIRTMKSRFNRASLYILEGWSIVTSLVCLAQLQLQIFNVMDIRNGLWITHIIIVIGAAIIIGVVIFDYIKYSEDYKNTFTKKFSLILIMGVLADVVAYYIRGNSSGLMFSLLAFLLYIVFTGVSMMFKYGEQEKQLAEKDRLLAENERQLTESHIATMMSQIQPHFLYNTLGTIKQLCNEQPEKAAKLVHNFALYLRGNFSELNNTTPIPLTKEMEHVRYYIYIEQVRFPDMTIRFDLRSQNFLLPALSIQPLVENAIKHGLMGLESGGIVTITTYETENDYFVRVEDDGVGFDTTKVLEEGNHFGIQNIRGRVEAMCGGTLTVESTPGDGTKALIKIPKSDNKNL